MVSSIKCNNVDSSASIWIHSETFDFDATKVEACLHGISYHDVCSSDWLLTFDSEPFTSSLSFGDVWDASTVLTLNGDFSFAESFDFIIISFGSVLDSYLSN